MSFESTSGFEFKVSDAKYRLDENGRVHKVVLETSDVPTDKITFKPRFSGVKEGTTDEGITTEQPVQKKYKPSDMPEEIVEILKEAKEQRFFKVRATVTQLDKSDEPEMQGEETYYFINSDNIETLEPIPIQ